MKIAGTLQEGEEVAGFEVVELPGHAPGQIGLWRSSDRLALTSDCFYVIDMWARDSAPNLPLALYNYDTEQARASLRKLAALDPAVAWPGHGNALSGDVRGQLERAARGALGSWAGAPGASRGCAPASSDYATPTATS